MQRTGSQCSFQLLSKLYVSPDFWVSHTQNNVSLLLDWFSFEKIKYKFIQEGLAF